MGLGFFDFIVRVWNICEYSVANKLVINVSVPVTFSVQIPAERTNCPKISPRPSHIRRVFASKEGVRISKKA